jgi:hypothetical protein
VLFKLQPCSETRADCKFSGQGVFPLEPELPFSGGSTLNKAKLLCCNVVVTQVYCRHTLLRHRTAVSNNERITKLWARKPRATGFVPHRTKLTRSLRCSEAQYL